MAAFLSLLQEPGLSHAGIARTRRPRAETYLHPCRSKVHSGVRRQRRQLSRSRSAALFRDGGPSTRATGAPASAFRASSISRRAPEVSRAHGAARHLAPRSLVPGRAGAVSPEGGPRHPRRRGSGLTPAGRGRRSGRGKQAPRMRRGPRVPSFVLHG